jgi:hypothetical protein
MIEHALGAHNDVFMLHNFELLREIYSRIGEGDSKSQLLVLLLRSPHSLYFIAMESNEMMKLGRPATDILNFSAAVRAAGVDEDYVAVCDFYCCVALKDNNAAGAYAKVERLERKVSSTRVTRSMPEREIYKLRILELWVEAAKAIGDRYL